MPEAMDLENAGRLAADAEYCAAALTALAEEGVLRMGEDVVVAQEELEAGAGMAEYVLGSVFPAGEGDLFRDSLASAALWCAWAGCCYEYGAVLGPDPSRAPGRDFRAGNGAEGTGRYAEQFAGCFGRLFPFLLERSGFDPGPEDVTRLCAAMFVAGTVAERKRLGAGEWSGSTDPAVLSREKR